MSGENRRGIVNFAFETIKWVSSPLARGIGSLAYSRSQETYSDDSLEPQPQMRLVERIQSGMPLNEAKIGRQFVEIGRMIDPRRASNSQERHSLKDRRRGYLVHGHTKIVKAVIEADENPLLDTEHTQEVIEIAREVGTDPTRLDGILDEEQQKHAEQIIDP